MGVNKPHLKWFLLIGTGYTFAIFLWLILTPSLPQEYFFLNYSFKRLVLMVASGIVLCTFSLALFFSQTSTVNHIFGILTSSIKWFLGSIFISLTTLLIIIGVLFGSFGAKDLLFERLFPIICLIFLLSSELIVFQQITSHGEMAKSVRLIVQNFLSTTVHSLTETRENKIDILVLFIVVAFFAALVECYFNGFYFKLPYPRNTFIFRPDVRFTDFFTIVRESIGLNPYQGTALSGQYPFLLIVGYLFSLIPETYSYLVYSILFSVMLFSFSLYFLRTKPWVKSILPAFVVTFLTYPFLWTIDRGNFESLVLLLLLFFILFYSQKKYIPASIFLACAAALKIYPAIFLLLFLKDKKFKEIGLTLATILALTFLSILSFKGGLQANIHYLLNFSNISNNPLFLSFVSLKSETLVQRGVTLLTLFKIIVLQNQITLPDTLLNQFSTIYSISVCILFIPVLFYTIFIEKELWKRVALLTFSMLLLPTISGDYKLLHVLLPLFLFINSKESNKLDPFYLLMFGLLLIPKNYFFFNKIVSDAGVSDISMAVPANIIIMLVTSLVIIISGFIKWKQDRPHFGAKGSSASSVLF